MKTGIPYRIHLALLLVSISATSLRAADESSPAAVHSAAAALEPFVNSHSLAGAVTLVADKDKVLSLEAVGMADIAANRPMSTDALFWIASQSKPITATALMMLVDEGKVNLDDPVEKYLPEFKGQWLAERPAPHRRNIRSRSATFSAIPADCRSSRRSNSPRSTCCRWPSASRSYAATPLDFEPDSNCKYSNAGINTAGRIIEVVSGMPYEEFLDTRLFGPLGMKDTTFWPNKEQLDAAGEIVQADGRQDRTRRDAHRSAQISARRSQSPADARRRVVLHGQRRRAILPDDFEWRPVRGKTLSVGSGGKTDDEQANRRLCPTATASAWSTDGQVFGHGGALATNMSIDTKRGLVLVYLVQHQGFPGNGGESQRRVRAGSKRGVRRVAKITHSPARHGGRPVPALLAQRYATAITPPQGHQPSGVSIVEHRLANLEPIGLPGLKQFEPALVFGFVPLQFIAPMASVSHFTAASQSPVSAHAAARLLSDQLSR